MIYFFLILLNFVFLFFLKPIEKKINIFDIPNEKKIHLKKTSLLGGVIFIVNITIYLSYEIFFKSTSPSSIFDFSSDISAIIFIFSFIVLFLLGFFDDKNDLSATLRILALIVIVMINLMVNPQINISFIKLSFADSFSIGSYSYIWTLLCFLLFINAFNFFDGINLQISGLIFAICTFFLTKNIFFNLFLIVLISNFFFTYLNYNSKTFLGNSGSFFLPFLFGALFISAYNNNINITSDEIVILMLVPGMDLLRLFFQRLLQRKNPLKGDREHIHHYLMKRYSTILSALIIQMLIWVPFILFQIFGMFFLALIIQVSFYVLIISKYKN